MSRPETTKDVVDRFTRVAMFEVEKIMVNATLLKHYTALLEAAQKIGGKAEKSYSTVDITIPKNEKELQSTLESDQYQWDEMQRFYNQALRRGEGNVDPIPEWRVTSIKRWAKEEGLPDPFDVFAANDPELAALRAELGMEEE